MMKGVQGGQVVNRKQRAEADRLGTIQRDKLLDALHNNPSIKRLALNPLMLTILALIQQSGRTLPQRRIELYQIVTRTLIDNWNREKGNKVFPQAQIPLAERLLSDLAYKMHSSDRMLIDSDVKAITCRAMDAFYEKPAGYTSAQDAEAFINVLRSSSGIYVESG